MSIVQVGAAARGASASSTTSAMRAREGLVESGSTRCTAWRALRGEAHAALRANQFELRASSNRSAGVSVPVNQEIGICDDDHEPHGSRGAQKY